MPFKAKAKAKQPSEAQEKMKDDAASAAEAKRSREAAVVEQAEYDLHLKAVEAKFQADLAAAKKDIRRSYETDLVLMYRGRDRNPAWWRQIASGTNTILD